MKLESKTAACAMLMPIGDVAFPLTVLTAMGFIFPTLIGMVCAFSSEESVRGSTVNVTISGGFAAVIGS